jgi:hypothetical protein
MDLASVKCPECQASLKVEPGRDEVTCSYCGATSRVREPAAPPVIPAPVVRPRPALPRYVVAIILAGFLLPVLIGVIAPIGMCVAASSAINASGPAPSEHMQWVGNRQPMLAQVNADGVADVIGWVRFLGGTSSFDHLAAFDGATGARLWLTAPISDGSQSFESKAAIAGDRLVVADPGGMLRSFLVSNGQPAWTAVLGERAERLCGGAPGAVRVDTTDGRSISVALATGQAAVIPRVKDCAGLFTDVPGETPTLAVDGRPFREGEPLPEVPGMRVTRALRDAASGLSVALGEREPGTRVPMAAGYEPKAGRRVLWVASIPSSDPLAVEQGASEVAAISVGRLLVSYSMADSRAGARLACIDATTGRSLWDAPIPASDTGDVGAIAASDREVFVSHWTYLDVFDLSSGALRLTIGRW